MIELLPGDYVIGGLAVIMAVTGLFRGFSGTLGFAVASAAAAFAGSFGWGYSATLTDVTWQRAAGVLAASLLVFGLVRMIVKKLVNGLLAQPTDALLGAAIGALLGGLLLVAWAYSGIYLEYSNLAREVATYVGR